MVPRKGEVQVADRVDRHLHPPFPARKEVCRIGKEQLVGDPLPEPAADLPVEVREFFPGAEPGGDITSIKIGAKRHHILPAQPEKPLQMRRQPRECRVGVIREEMDTEVQSYEPANGNNMAELVVGQVAGVVMY